MKQVKDNSKPDEETAAGEGYRHFPFQKDKGFRQDPALLNSYKSKNEVQVMGRGVPWTLVEKIMSPDLK